MALAEALRAFVMAFAEAVADGTINRIELIRLIKRGCQVVVAALELFVPDARPILQQCVDTLAKIQT